MCYNKKKQLEKSRFLTKIVNILKEAMPRHGDRRPFMNITKLKRLRKENGLTLDELARIIGSDSLVSVIGITDAGFTKAMTDRLAEET